MEQATGARRAAVAMSGGVDSSVAALLLAQAGWACTGVTLRLYAGADAAPDGARTCCSLEDVEDARAVARRLGIRHYTFNFTEAFERDVIGRFVQGYLAGETPNPCIDCNKHIKFSALLRRAQLMGCTHVATGHYARIVRGANGRMLLQTGLDAGIAGHFAGSAAISAINNSGQILNILTKIAIGITTGGNIIIGQYYGAKEHGRLGEASGTLLSLSLLLGAATAVGLYAGAYPLLGLLGAPAMEQSVAYLRICAVGMVFVFGYNALSAVLRGVGDSRTPLLIIGVATVVNTVLDLWFVAGLGMGTAGAALATTAAQAVSFGMALVLVARRTGLLQPKLSFFRMHGALLRLILRLGIPSALQMTIAGFSWLVVTFLVNQYGVDVSAGNGVAIKIKDICQLFISAMASGATTMIAQNLGASKFERAKDVMYTAMKITCAMAAAMIVLVELFAPQMAAVFTNEAAVRDAAVLNLRIEILGQIFYAVFMVYHALAIGAGHSTFAMLSSFANCIVFRVVLSLLFNHLWGIYGLYAACAVAPSISVPLGWLYTRSGVWRRSLAKTEK